MVCCHGNRKKTQPLGTYSMPCILFQQNMNGAEIILEEMIKKNCRRSQNWVDERDTSSHNWAVFNRWFAIKILDLKQERQRAAWSLHSLNLLTAALSFPRGLIQARLCPSGDRLILTAAWRKKRESQSARQMLGPDPSPTRAGMSSPAQRPKANVCRYKRTWRNCPSAFKFYVTGTFIPQICTWDTSAGTQKAIRCLLLYRGCVWWASADRYGGTSLPVRLQLRFWLQEVTQRP